MENKKGFLDKFQSVMMPIGTFLANEKHFASISNGLMATVGLTLVGAIFQILSNPPVTAEMMAEGGILPTLFGWWYHFATTFKDVLLVPYNMTVNLFAVVGALVAAGGQAIFHPVFITGAIAMVGGTGNTLGLVILSLFKAKSQQLKAIGKASVIPGIFGINEPVAFGAPIVFNPILMIPYILGTLILGIILWVSYGIGLYDPRYVLILSTLPIGLAGFMTAMSVKNFIYQIVLIPVMMLIWYPFFKIYDKQLVLKEAAVKESDAYESKRNEKI